MNLQDLEKIQSLKREIQQLQEGIVHKQNQLTQLQKKVFEPCKYSKELSSEEIKRYSRQIIMPQITLEGQIALKNSNVLIIGAGGLGCPALLYLASAGVGNITIADYDEVELSNLHRQILHYETDIGRSKVESASSKTFLLNNNCHVTPLKIHAHAQRINEIFNGNFNVVLDCSDNVPTRYLINDLCVFNKIPLVSGSALKMEGQLTVYNHDNGPCYRCLFPKPPPPETVTNCGDGGVLGPVAGVIGVLQALETVKIITKNSGVLSGRLLLFDGVETNFRTVKLRGKNANCDVCGDNPTIISPVDYEQFCNAKSHDKIIDIDILNDNQNVSANLLPKFMEEGKLILDVRPEIEFEMCHLEKTLNVPIDNLSKSKIDCLKKVLEDRTDEVYTLCRRGNDSQRAVEILKQHFPSIRFLNITGGLGAYSNLIDKEFPLY